MWMQWDTRSDAIKKGLVFDSQVRICWELWTHLNNEIQKETSFVQDQDYRQEDHPETEANLRKYLDANFQARYDRGSGYHSNQPDRREMDGLLVVWWQILLDGSDIF